LNPVEVTTSKKPRLFRRGSFFYGKMEFTQNFGIKKRTSSDSCVVSYLQDGAQWKTAGNPGKGNE